jgi:hypothetical protein
MDLDDIGFGEDEGQNSKENDSKSGHRPTMNLIKVTRRRRMVSIGMGLQRMVQASGWYLCICQTRVFSL